MNSLKESLSKGAGSSKIADDLNEARSVRDQAHQSLANLLIGKALVQSSLDVAQHVHDIKVGLNESCQQYTRLYSRVCDEKAIVKQTLDKKVRLRIVDFLSLIHLLHVSSCCVNILSSA